MGKTIRLRKSIRTTGVVCLLSSLALGIASVVGVVVEPPPNPRLRPIYVAIVVGAFWSLMSSLAVWLLLTFWRGRVVVTDDTLAERGVIRTSRIRFDEIERIVWKPAPPWVRLDTPTTRLKIDLSKFELEDRLWLIRNLRSRPAWAQEAWEMFCVKVAVPLQQSEIAEGQTPDPNMVTLTRNRWACYLGPMTLLFVVAGIVLSWMLDTPRMLAAPFPILLLWAFLHFSTPKKGLAMSRISAEPDNRRFLVFLLAWGGLGLAGNFLLTALKLPQPQMIAWSVGGLVLWCSVLMYKAVELDRKRQQRDRVRIPAAMKTWDNGESARKLSE